MFFGVFVMDNINIDIDDSQKKRRSIKDYIKTYCSLPSFIIFCVCFFAAIVHITCLLSERFADFYNQNIGAFVRGVLAYITSWMPFSLAETVIIAMPVVVVLLICHSIKMLKKSEIDSTRWIVALVSVLSLLYSVFVLGYGMGYHGTSLASKLDLKEEKVSTEELKNTALILSEKLTPLLDDVVYNSNGSSVMPYSLDEMNDKLNDAYKKASKKYSFLQDLKSNLKYIVLSEPMTYTHISGVYSYYTGEANININFPDYTVPFTAAHELAHQRGIAPENEANFVAFLVCLESDDVYIKYSAYLNMFEYVSNALYSADYQMYYDLFSSIDSKLQGEMIAYSAFFEKYRDSVVSDVSDAVNDTYLNMQGQSAGTASYGMVVDLAVAYYKKKI